MLLPKLCWTTERKKTSDQEKLLNFKAEGQEFANFWDHLLPDVSQIIWNRTISIEIGKKKILEFRNM